MQPTSTCWHDAPPGSAPLASMASAWPMLKGDKSRPSASPGGACGGNGRRMEQGARIPVLPVLLAILKHVIHHAVVYHNLTASHLLSKLVEHGCSKRVHPRRQLSCILVQLLKHTSRGGRCNVPQTWTDQGNCASAKVVWGKGPSGERWGAARRQQGGARRWA